MILDNKHWSSKRNVVKLIAHVSSVVKQNKYCTAFRYERCRLNSIQGMRQGHYLGMESILLKYCDENLQFATSLVNTYNGSKR